MQPMKPLEPMQPLEFREFSHWWPESFGTPDIAGNQNDVHYAYFRNARRLLLRRGDEITTYDTSDHDIQGVSQVSDTTHAIFVSNQGTVDLDRLRKL